MAYGNIVGQQPEIPQPYDVGDIKISIKNSLGEDWVLCNGQEVDTTVYPEVAIDIAYRTPPFRLSKAYEYSDAVFMQNSKCCFVDGDYIYFAYNPNDERAKIVRVALPFSKNAKKEELLTTEERIQDYFFKKVGEYFILAGTRLSPYPGILYVSKDGEKWTKYSDSSQRSWRILNACYLNGKYYFIFNLDNNSGQICYAENIEASPYDLVDGPNKLNIALSEYCDFAILENNLVISDIRTKFLLIGETPDSATSFKKIELNIGDNLQIEFPFLSVSNKILYYLTTMQLYKVNTNGTSLVEDFTQPLSQIQGKFRGTVLVPYLDNGLIFDISRGSFNDYYALYYYNLITKDFYKLNTPTLSSNDSFNGFFANDKIHGLFTKSFRNNPSDTYYDILCFPQQISFDTNTFIKIK